ncbi:hypothetical protein C8F01DRAFT_455295 [Mycena amicta]|nr:hypothetical protein C8F01DRAFT_455295 [Mycena amicta]
MSSPANPSAGPSTPPMSRYVVQSSDVLEDLIINVKEEGSDKVLWFKERFLEDEEIIEHLVHKESGRIRWTMHRPRSGWYIRIRAPTFPPGAYIPLIPPPPNSDQPPGSLLFSSRTNAVIPSSRIPPPLETRASTSSVHSYPPTPPPAPTLVVHPPTPADVQAHLNQSQQRQRPPPQVITQFVLAPYQIDGGLKPEEMSFFQRALSAIRKNSAGPSYSFTLGRVEPVSPPPLPTLPPSSPSTTALAPTPAIPHLITFTDRTPAMTVHAITGLLEVSQAEEQMLGVESSFWVAVALTYLEFLQEKESYLAALSD